MEQTINRSVTRAFLITASMAACLASNMAYGFSQHSQPKLILQITVDQLRADLPRRYMANMGDKGFKYLYKNGVVFNNAHHSHANTETIVGHTTLATGATPSVHGMIGNIWYDRGEQRLVYNIEDANYPLIDKNADVNKKTEIDPTQRKARSSGRSPANIKVSTFSDELASQTANHAKIFAVSVKDRGAVSMAGHKGKAFWFSKKTGEFVTSHYYYDKYPTWVTTWNSKKEASQFDNKAWQLLHPKQKYLFGQKDDQAGEIKFPGFGNVFPHQYGKSSSKYFNTFLTLSPAGDELTASFAKELIVKENIGKDDITDYLSVSFSSTDYVGHLFGSSSLEMEDNILRLDRTLASLLSFVDKKVGLKNTLIVLSADHGGADTVEYSHEQGLHSGHMAAKLWDEKKMAARLSNEFGLSTNVILSYNHPYVYLDKKMIASKKLNLGHIEQVIAEEISQIPGVATAISAHKIIHGQHPSSPLYQAVENNHDMKRSGEVFVVFEPYHFINDMDGLSVAAHHGSPWKYDSHVPVIFLGEGLVPQQVNRKIHTTAIAPTLANAIGSKAPSGSSGEVLHEIKKH